MFNFTPFRAGQQVKTHGLLKEYSSELSQWEPFATSDKTAISILVPPPGSYER